jgi:hypothetical protein
LTNGLMGCATLSAGVGRLPILLTNTEDVLVSRRDCMLKIWNLFFIWTDPMCSIALLVVSTDRLLAIGMPIRYHISAGRLGYQLVIGAHAFLAISVIIGWTLTLLLSGTEKQYSSICWSSDAINSTYFIYHTWLRIIAALLSVIFYFFVIVLMRIQAKKVAPAQVIFQQNLSMFSKRQNRLTISMGISCLFTCLFVIVPICFEMYTLVSNSAAETLASILPYSRIISNLNPISNAIIVLHRQIDIRRSLLSFISCGTISSTIVTEAMMTSWRATTGRIRRTVGPTHQVQQLGSISRPGNEQKSL